MQVSNMKIAAQTQLRPEQVDFAKRIGVAASTLEGKTGKQVSALIKDQLYQSEVYEAMRLTGSNDEACIRSNFPTLDALDLLLHDHTQFSDRAAQKEIFVAKKYDEWEHSPRWKRIKRFHTPEQIWELRGNIQIEHTVAKITSKKLWELINRPQGVDALGALNPAEVIMQIVAGMEAGYGSGWMMAAKKNSLHKMFPDLGIYPQDTAPLAIKEIMNALIQNDKIYHLNKDDTISWLIPYIIDMEAGFGGLTNVFELAQNLTEAGAAGKHLEDQDSANRGCGHVGANSKLIIPTPQMNEKLNTVRLADDIADVPTIIMARTDSKGAAYFTSDEAYEDAKHIIGRTENRRFFTVKGSLKLAIERGIAYAPHADMIWFETSAKPEDLLPEAKEYADAMNAAYPGIPLGYNDSSSLAFEHLDDKTLKQFNDKLAEYGYKYRFITLPEFHTENLSMFQLAKAYKEDGLLAYARIQREETKAEKEGYTGKRHQKVVGTGYWDEIKKVASGGGIALNSLEDSSETAHFKK